MKNRLPIIAGILLLAGAAFYFYSPGVKDEGIIRMSGNVEATTVAVSFRIPGKLKERHVEEGMPVRRGERVAELESDDLDQEVAQRLAERDAARAALDEAESGSRREEITRAEAAATRGEAEAMRLEREAARGKSLYDRQVISKQQLETSETAALAARAAAREAGETLKLVRKGPRSEQIAALRARLRSSEAVLTAARMKRGYASVSSPLDGIVMAKHAEPGEELPPGAPVVTIGDLKHVWVRTYLPETDLGRIKPGMRAVITTDTFPGKKYQGAVSFIAGEAEFTPRTVQTEKERVKLVFRVKISVENPNLELKPGMPADAVLETERAR
jgi:HlyD family secretion protein